MLAQRFIAGSPRCPLLSSPGVPEGRATTAKASTKFLPPGVTITTLVSCRELTPGAKERGHYSLFAAAGRLRRRLLPKWRPMAGEREGSNKKMSNVPFNVPEK